MSPLDSWFHLSYTYLRMLNDLDDKIKNYQSCYDALVTLQADALQTDDESMSPRWNVIVFFFRS